MSKNNPLIEVKNLKVHFPVRQGLLHNITGYIKAVDGINFSINKGETLGLVGESGCGKTTTARAILHLIKPTSGDIFFDYYDETLQQSSVINLPKIPDNVMKQVRKKAQMIFQDPYSSLDPRMKIKDIIIVQTKAHHFFRLRARTWGANSKGGRLWPQRLMSGSQLRNTAPPPIRSSTAGITMLSVLKIQPQRTVI